jgi:hypothetical protein
LTRKPGDLPSKARKTPPAGRQGDDHDLDFFIYRAPGCVGFCFPPAPLTGAAKS